MIHGDLKGVRLFFFFTARGTPNSPSLPTKANILIDQTGCARLADFGLLTIISDPKYVLSSSSHTQGGTVRWMSPERIAPDRFGFKNSRPTVSSDCYSLGMVIYETISGNVPFHKDTDPAVFMKVVEGKHPPRGVKFTKSLWGMLERCWASGPNNRPSIETVLQCLEAVPSLPGPSSPGADEEVEEDDDYSDSTTDSSGTPNWTSGAAITEVNAVTSSESNYPIDDPIALYSIGSGPSNAKAANETYGNPLVPADWPNLPPPRPLPQANDQYIPPRWSFRASSPLRNDVVSENVFEREEGRVPLQAGTPLEFGFRLGGNEEEDEEGSSKVQRGQQNSRGASPASSVRSRISASSFRTPSVSSQLSRDGGSTDDIEVDSLPSTSSTRTQKRKATKEIDENDDEIQIIDNPDTSA